MLETLLPLAAQVLGGSGGGGGLLGGLLGGGKTETTQSVSQSTSAALLASINNTIGGGSSATGSLSAPVTQNPNAVSTAGAAPSPAPVLGQTFGLDYTPGDLAAEVPGGISTESIFPLLALGAVGVGAWLIFKELK